MENGFKRKIFQSSETDFKIPFDNGVDCGIGMLDTARAFGRRRVLMARMPGVSFAFISSRR